MPYLRLVLNIPHNPLWQQMILLGVKQKPSSSSTTTGSSWLPCPSAQAVSCVGRGYTTRHLIFSTGSDLVLCQGAN
ncbi:hypothetical protein EB796_023436 [Bugula neritina]|uniref:Uncharacterized protein n=1 Tax=Bugula neritina TaxID=10212 RepID=A0A7J7IY08_BUGNE|nr:hypothetical protein EB796_023436 [Bugula neritina]